MKSALRLATTTLAVLCLLACSKITAENYNRVEKGMSYDEVTAILGAPTESKSVGIGPLSGTAASWVSGKTRIDIKFVNQKVQLKSLDVEEAPEG